MLLVSDPVDYEGGPTGTRARDGEPHVALNARTGGTSGDVAGAVGCMDQGFLTRPVRRLHRECVGQDGEAALEAADVVRRRCYDCCHRRGATASAAFLPGASAGTVIDAGGERGDSKPRPGAWTVARAVADRCEVTSVTVDVRCPSGSAGVPSPPGCGQHQRLPLPGSQRLDRVEKP